MRSFNLSLYSRNRTRFDRQVPGRHFSAQPQKHVYKTLGKKNIYYCAGESKTGLLKCI